MSLGRVLPTLASSANIETWNFARARGLTLDGNGEKLCTATRLAAGTRYSMPEVQRTCSLVLLGDHGAEKTRALLENQ